jgi:hypothetical protein
MPPRTPESPSHSSALLLPLLFCSLLSCSAQSGPPGLRQADVTAFAGISSVSTGLSGGRSTSTTFGLDLNLPESHLVRPSLEVRATIPLGHGPVDDQRDVLGGLRIGARINRVHPYVDFLAGHGAITFNRPYTTYSGALLYSQPPSIVLSPGAGFRFDLAANISAFADAQIQRWDTPASLSGHLFSKPVTFGLVYRFTYTHHGYPSR